jgi:hypothetical protein
LLQAGAKDEHSTSGQSSLLGLNFTPGRLNFAPGGLNFTPGGELVKTGLRGSSLSRVDVMMTIFCDFSQFSAKQMAFFLITNVMINCFQNLALFRVKNAIFFAKCFGKNI